MSEQSGTPRTTARWKEEWEHKHKNAHSDPAHGMLDWAEQLEGELTAAQSALAAEKEARAIIPPSYLQLTAERNDAIERADAAESKLAKVEQICDESIEMARLMGASEHMRVAATIKDRIRALSPENGTEEGE